MSFTKYKVIPFANDYQITILLDGENTISGFYSYDLEVPDEAVIFVRPEEKFEIKEGTDVIDKETDYKLSLWPPLFIKKVEKNVYNKIYRIYKYSVLKLKDGSKYLINFSIEDRDIISKGKI